MQIAVKLKTGFFKTSAYRMQPDRSGLRFLPIDLQDGEIFLPAQEILSVTFHDREKAWIEISTRNGVCEGIFDTAADCREALVQLHESMDIRIICEYNGKG